PVAIEVLDGGLVAPGDLVARPAEDRRDAVALLRAGRPPAQRDREDPLLIHTRALGQLPGVEPVLDAELLDRPGRIRHDDSPPPRWAAAVGPTQGLRPNCGP